MKSTTASTKNTQVFIVSLCSNIICRYIEFSVHYQCDEISSQLRAKSKHTTDENTYMRLLALTKRISCVGKISDTTR